MGVNEIGLRKQVVPEHLQFKDRFSDNDVIFWNRVRKCIINESLANDLLIMVWIDRLTTSVSCSSQINYGSAAEQDKPCNNSLITHRMISHFVQPYSEQYDILSNRRHCVTIVTLIQKYVLQGVTKLSVSSGALLMNKLSTFIFALKTKIRVGLQEYGGCYSLSLLAYFPFDWKSADTCYQMHSRVSRDKFPPLFIYAALLLSCSSGE